MGEKEAILNKRFKRGPKSVFVWLKRLFLTQTPACFHMRVSSCWDFKSGAGLYSRRPPEGWAGALTVLVFQSRCGKMRRLSNHLLISVDLLVQKSTGKQC